jgi:hypothetical protein
MKNKNSIKRLMKVSTIKENQRYKQPMLSYILKRDNMDYTKSLITQVTNTATPISNIM